MNIKKTSLLLLAILLCTARVEASFEEEGHDRDDHSKSDTHGDVTARNTSAAQLHAGRAQHPSPNNVTITEGDNEGMAPSDSAGSFEDDESENIFDDATMALTKKDAQNSFLDIIKDQEEFHKSLSENTHIPHEELTYTLGELIYAHDFWTKKSDQYGHFYNYPREEILTDIKKQNTIELIEACDKAKLAAEKYIHEIHIMLNPRQLDSIREFSSAEENSRRQNGWREEQKSSASQFSDFHTPYSQEGQKDSSADHSSLDPIKLFSDSIVDD